VSDQAQNGEAAVSKRGEAAWKEEKDRIAERNDAARKVGKQRREAKDRLAAEARRAAQRREMAEAIGKHDVR
jgi:hypothetical protein